MAFFKKARVRRRVRKALKKYVRRNAAGKWVVVDEYGSEASVPRSKGEASKISARLHRVTGRKYKLKEKSNPPRTKGRKVKGGRAVTLRNFTGTIVRKSDGRVEILGRGRKR